MARVWLTNWEWSCCGEPFGVGDRVDFGVERRGPDDWLIATLGVEIARTVDAIESHHEEELPDRIRGLVRAIQSVTHDVIERRELRRPGHGAPSDTLAPSQGEQWAEVRGQTVPVSWGARPSRYILVSEPVPGTVRMHPRNAVPTSAEDRETGGENEPFEDDGATPTATGPTGRRLTSSPGWLVDVDEH
jgi:hypothetical protein